MKTDKRELSRPSRRQAYSSGIRKWLRRPGVLGQIIAVARLCWWLWDKLFGDDPWTFYSLGKDSSCAA